MSRDLVPASFDPVHAFLCRELASWTDDRPMAIGLCGAQGSGKSTLASALEQALDRQGRRVLALSLDDLYLPRSERQHLAETVHPLLATRGVPGTHDIALGHAVFDRAAENAEVPVPSFDKASDDRVPRRDWGNAPGPVDVILLEGWCVGARAQRGGALAKPVNHLERRQDADGSWRRYVNRKLATDYARFFARLDRLVLLQAPGFEVVSFWRGEQEAELRASRAQDGGSIGIMDEAALSRFIQHYERLTRHISTTAPEYADLVVSLDRNRQVVAVHGLENR